MKNILLTFAFAILATSNANALNCQLDHCGTSIAGDSGHPQKKCYTTGSGCNCTAGSLAAQIAWVENINTACPNGYEDEDLIGGTQHCCWTYSKAPQAQPESVPAEDLNTVFADNMGSRTNYYYGYVDSTNRSPSNGRTSDPMAKLDACLFHTDVTAIDNTVGTADDKHHACVGASIGCGTTLKNEYCQASGTNDGATVSAAVCKDRCDCIYSGAEGSVCGGN
jgi:hypothetical protein